MSEPVSIPTRAEYDQLRTDAGLVDRSSRLRMTFIGAQAAATLNGLCTSDVLALQPGHGQYAAALTSKGKILADVRIFQRAAETANWRASGVENHVGHRNGNSRVWLREIITRDVT